MNITNTLTQIAPEDSAARTFCLDPVCKVVAMLKDLAQQRRPIDPRLLHCCLSLITTSSHLPATTSTPANAASAALAPAFADTGLEIPCCSGTTLADQII